MDLVTLLASVAVGLIVGVLSGLLGIGGGTMMIPIFKLGYLMPSIMCTGTSLFTVLLTAISGSISHIRKRTCIPRMGLVLGIGGALTSWSGVLLASISPDWLIMAVAALIIMYSAYTMLRKALALKKPPAATAASSVDKTALSPNTAVSSAQSVAASSVESALELPVIGARELIIGLVIGAIAGVASGYVGVGGGFLMVPMMIALINVPMKLASGTSLIAIMILSVPGIVSQAALGNIAWTAGIAIAIGSIPGAIFGSRLLPKIPERQLRFLFAILLFVAAILLVLNEFSIWG